MECIWMRVSADRCQLGTTAVLQQPESAVQSGHPWLQTGDSHMFYSNDFLTTVSLQSVVFQLKDNAIHVLLRNCTDLKTLSIANCPLITDVSLNELANQAQSLR